jgi:lipopolysaccharide export LptBFGC system permease protein LptF
MVNSTDAAVVILVVIGAIVLLIGVAGGYIASLSFPDYFPVWLVVAFIGIILALAGIAMGMGRSERKE